MRKDFKIQTLNDNLRAARAKKGIDLKKYYLPYGYKIQKRKRPLSDSTSSVPLYSSTGAAVGTIIPGIGSAVGAAVGTIAGFFSDLFSGGSVYGSDFPQRALQTQAWANQFGLGGNLSKYINAEVVKSLLYAPSGTLSPYTKNNGVWQSDIQQYFSAIKGVLNGNPPTTFDGGSAFVQLAKDYINKINNLTGTTSEQSLQIAGGGLNLTTILLIGAGAFFLLGKNKK